MLVRYEIYRQGHIQLAVREEDEQGLGTNKLSVDVYYHSKFGQAAQAEVSWSSLGSVNHNVAGEYAAMISKAAHLAETMNNGRWAAVLDSESTLAVLGQGEQVVRKVEGF